LIPSSKKLAASSRPDFKAGAWLVETGFSAAARSADEKNRTARNLGPVIDSIRARKPAGPWGCHFGFDSWPSLVIEVFMEEAV
jgi:hypothetical protein